MGLMEAMTRYTKKDPYEEALVQMDKKDPEFAKFLQYIFVTLDTSHLLSGWLKECAFTNILYI